MPSQLDRRPGEASRRAGKHEEKEGLQLSFIQVLASALAAVSGAIVTSAFGVGGTIIGAAIMSTIATCASAIYGHSIKRTSRMLRQPFHPDAHPRSTATRGYGGAGYSGAAGAGGAGTAGGAAGAGRSGTASAERSGTTDPTRAYGPATRYGQATRGGASRSKKGAAISAADGPAEDSKARPGYTAPRTYGKGRRLDRRVGLVLGIAMSFVIAIGVLTVIELITGQSSAGLWGQGGTGPSITGGGETAAPSPTPTSPSPSPTDTGTPTPTATPTPTPTSTSTHPPTPTRTPTPTPTKSPLPQLQAPPATRAVPSAP